ncbi:hypothetical protein ZEAMMB73_Zm00001d009033 [Zea mays]|uniref:Uncharacterized protein n=1 Tax=Zea mays TaxID=4577 RepID=A0A1D6FHC7_MAIZE|nr:hypothetical protein ZEAMMB73_Zm00001d009033 [Zea mays]
MPSPAQERACEACPVSLAWPQAWAPLAMGPTAARQHGRWPASPPPAMPSHAVTVNRKKKGGVWEQSFSAVFEEYCSILKYCSIIYIMVFGKLGPYSFWAGRHQLSSAYSRGGAAHEAVPKIILYWFYYTRIAYYAYKGYKGLSFSNIPPI